MWKSSQHPQGTVSKRLPRSPESVKISEATSGVEIPGSMSSSVTPGEDSDLASDPNSSYQTSTVLPLDDKQPRRGHGPLLEKGFQTFDKEAYLVNENCQLLGDVRPHTPPLPPNVPLSDYLPWKIARASANRQRSWVISPPVPVGTHVGCEIQTRKLSQGGRRWLEPIRLAKQTFP
ncbi:hypothetical protein MJT46_000071 [Ovis ammon polii x Ovis aries]|nr:hypothetical protein MJT46_000071 [Ovis ammon polii x Ovis aries]